jgi:hypothetical protein
MLVQDWVTLQLTADAAQGADKYLDVSAYEDLVFFLEVKQILSVQLTMEYQTAPNRLSSDFVTMVSFTPVTGVRTDAVLASYAAVPIARYVRWYFSTGDGGNGNITFRLWAAGYSL